MLEEEEPDSVRCLALVEAHEDRLEAARLSYAAARRAVALVRIYRSEPGTTGRRERECLAEVARLRRVIADGRAADERSRSAPMPGVRKVDVSSHDAAEAMPPNRHAG
jgi:hypothetical protein